MIDRLDARARHWRLPAKALYLAVKWTLVGLGAFIVWSLSVERLGYLGASLCWATWFGVGFWRGLVTAWARVSSLRPTRSD